MVLKIGKRIVKISFLGIILLVVIGFFRVGYMNKPKSIVKVLPYNESEFKNIKYRIYYLGFIPFGEISIENKGVSSLLDKPAYHLKAYLKSVKLIDFLFNIEGEFESWIDKDNLCVLKSRHKLDVLGDNKEDKTIVYDQVNHSMDIEGEK